MDQANGMRKDLLVLGRHDLTDEEFRSQGVAMLSESLVLAAGAVVGPDALDWLDLQKSHT